MTETATADAVTEGATASAAADPERGKRGRGFPTMDLLSAAETIAKVGGHGTDVPVSAFAQYLGHSTHNSGPFKSKLAAFQAWSLVTLKGGRVILTPLGKDLAKAEDPKADLALLRRAFESCKVFKDFYDNQAKGVPIKRDVLGKRATIDLNVSAASQEKFVTTLVDSAAAVGLVSSDAEAGTVTFTRAAAAEPAEPEGSHDEAEPEAKGATGATGATATQPRTTHAPAAAPASVAPAVLRQVWPTATGEVVLAIHSTEPLPASAFGLVGQVVKAAEDLAKSIGLPAPAAKGQDDAS
jgi:hypothetical protein